MAFKNNVDLILALSLYDVAIGIQVRVRKEKKPHFNRIVHIIRMRIGWREYQ